MTAFYAAVILTIGGILALGLKVIQILVKNEKPSKTAADWFDQLLYSLTRSGIRAYIKGAQWLGSGMFVLLLIGASGLLVLYIIER